MGQQIVKREAIIAEYLVGETTYRKLQLKYGIDYRVIHSWVMKYQGKNQKSSSPPQPKEEDQLPLPTEVKALQGRIAQSSIT